MENLKVDFEIIPDGKSPPVNYRKSIVHLIFYLRMTLECKSRWVKDAHETPKPEWSTFVGVLSRKSIRIAIMCASLNDLPVFGADIQNTYLQYILS